MSDRFILPRRAFIAGAAALAATPALAQTPPATEPGTPTAAPPETPPVAPVAPVVAPPPESVAPAPPQGLGPPPRGTVRVKLTTGEGLIVLDLRADKAPITTANFLRYVDQKRYDHATFYRASRTKGAPEFGVVQGGLQNDPQWVLPPIAHEPTTKTGLSHQDGTISVGRFKPGTATSDFFICVGESTYLDADPKAKGDNLGFAAFGQVVQGMDVVKKILALPTSPTAGVGVMKGEILRKPVPILRARRA